ncbi:hypothetical protein SK128_007796 [Halocaridina rubra]|uniref:Uncharacterized protein n=1 Tax=Halocaridina rubra TaxID=373956 RepID=A0AAN9A8G0_HALRR
MNNYETLTKLACLLIGTFVKEYDIYWVGVTSEKVVVTRSASETGSSPSLVPSAVPASTATPTSTSVTSSVSQTPSSSPGVGFTFPENVGDSVINIVDAPGVDGEIPLVENGLGVVSNDDESSTTSFSLFPLFSSTPAPNVNTFDGSNTTFSSDFVSPSLSTSQTFPSTTSSSDISPFGVDVAGNVPGSADAGNNANSNITVTESPSEDFVDEVVTPRSEVRTTPKRRVGIFGNFRTTTAATTQSTAASVLEDDFVETPVSSDNSAVSSNVVESLPTGGSSLKSAMQNIYLGCESSKGCFGFPKGCEDNNNCDMLMTYAQASSGYRFEIMGSTGSSSGYVAGALSSDDRMLFTLMQGRYFWKAISNDSYFRCHPL